MNFSIHCPICSATDFSLKYVVGQYQIYTCHNCRGGFTNPRPSDHEVPEIYSEEYLDSYTKSPMHGTNQSEWRFEQLSGRLRKAKQELFNNPRRSVLDVGCATGNFLACFKNAGWETVGIDVSMQLAELAAQKNGLDVIVGDFVNVEIEPQSFTLVTMVHVIEHFLDPIKAMQSAREVLIPGGLLFMETPNWEGVGSLFRQNKWSALIPPEHLNYFGPSSMKRLAEKTDFRIISQVTVTPPHIESIQDLATFVRYPIQIAYSLASLINRGPTLQVLLRKE